MEGFKVVGFQVWVESKEVIGIARLIGWERSIRDGRGLVGLSSAP
jgi:hypothetical protein